MNELKQALDAFASVCVRNGGAVMLGQINHGDYDWADWEPSVKAAESAVLAIFEAREARILRLERALQMNIDLWVIHAPGHAKILLALRKALDESVAHYAEVKR
jgi:hypothetical protein